MVYRDGVVKGGAGKGKDGSGKGKDGSGKGGFGKDGIPDGKLIVTLVKVIIIQLVRAKAIFGDTAFLWKTIQYIFKTRLGLLTYIQE